MKTIRIPFFLFLVCLTVGGIVGCSKSTSPTAPNNTTTVPMPTIGTTYITVDNSSDTAFDTVVATTMIDSVHHGSIVRELTQTDAITHGVVDVYESFLTNGDVALDGNSTGWGRPGGNDVLPFASHTTVRDTFTTNNGTVIFFDTVTVVYNGPGTPLKINGQTYATDSVTVTALLGTQFYYCFAPALGLISFYSNGSYSEWVTAYSPK